MSIRNNIEQEISVCVSRPFNDKVSNKFSLVARLFLHGYDDEAAAFLDVQIPGYHVINTYNLSEKEISALLNIARANSKNIWQAAHMQYASELKYSPFSEDETDEYSSALLSITTHPRVRGL